MLFLSVQYYDSIKLVFFLCFLLKQPTISQRQAVAVQSVLRNTHSLHSKDVASVFVL
jgi:hypothetical protein